MRQRIDGLRVLAAALLIVGGVQAASAQDDPLVVAANYDVVYHEFTETSAVGAHVDVAKVFGVLGIVGEVGFNHFKEQATQNATIISPAAGIRYLLARPGSGGKIEPAVQVLFGQWRCGSGCGNVNEKFIQPGFLVDIPRSPTLKIRFAFDVRRILFEFGGENAERASVGAVWAF